MNWLGFITLLRRELGRTKRVLGQAVIAPLITASLYLFVFGFVVGGRVDTIAGMPYLTFVFPGIVGMNLLLAVFGATSFSAFFLKFQKTLEDLLTLPLSYTELVLSLVASGVIRALVIAAALSGIAMLFGIVGIAHPLVFLAYVLLIAMLFGFMGIVVGIWADNSFEKIGLATNFLLTPLTFLGGAFYSMHMLPPHLQFLLHFNPVFYAIDGIRYALVGHHEASLAVGGIVLGSLSLLALGLCVQIFRTGWKLRT